jgi:hypothetical protein
MLGANRSYPAPLYALKGLFTEMAANLSAARGCLYGQFTIQVAFSKTLFMLGSFGKRQG